MNIIKAIQKNHFDSMLKRGWDKTYWAIDIHGTIIKPNYEAGNIPKTFYPYSLECLRLLSDREDVCLILYTCSHPHEIEEYLELFRKEWINFKFVNENPEVKTEENGYGCYDRKFYFNVLFEDKAGFDPEVDWEEIFEYLRTNKK
jgi:DNA modification methylase